jgi:hypothetical protein
MLTALPSLSVAQSGVPGNFYEKNFADSPKLGVESVKAPLDLAPQERVESSNPNQAVAVRPSAVTGAQSSSEKSKSATRLRMRVSLYVSSKDKPHFETVVRKALGLAEKNPGVIVTEIIHIGDYHNVSASIQDEIKAKKIFFASMVQVPTRYNVQDSPTWILRDAQGEHIVEGVVAIERCISPQGEYREPERSMFEVAPTPTMGVKSF